MLKDGALQTDETRWCSRGTTVFKRPSDTLRVGFGAHEDAALRAGAAIALSTWTAAPVNPRRVATDVRVEAARVEGTTTTARLTGGCAGEFAVVTNTIRTAAGTRIDGPSSWCASPGPEWRPSWTLRWSRNSEKRTAPSPRPSRTRGRWPRRNGRPPFSREKVRRVRGASPSRRAGRRTAHEAAARRAVRVVRGGSHRHCACRFNRAALA